ncbi:hypothetical protein [Lolliginicoccus suaedae]|uniref:hypothetical protein n=1 Tax=Lolliginicoccus suaedae TaxID=2605429 RepID=UPI0016592D24|nr:hypothetical protein [Lolliginicoccus suaedae]
MTTTTAHEHPSLARIFRDQPLPVWITAFAAVVLAYRESAAPEADPHEVPALAAAAGAD